MTVKVGGGSSDYSFEGFIEALKSGLSLSVTEPVSFDIEARSHQRYEKVSSMLRSKQIIIEETRRHQEASQPIQPEALPAPSLDSDEFPLIVSAQTLPAPSAPIEIEPEVNNYESMIPNDIEAMLSGVSKELEEEKRQSEDHSSDAIVFTFGSSKGGSGKTFTCIASARRYAQLHPEKRVALIDLDIIDAQVGISLHYVSPNVNNAYLSWLSNGEDLDLNSSYRETDLGKNLHVFAGNSSGLSKDRYPDDFWIDFLTKIVGVYDTVFIDTGIDYLNIEPIRMAYQIADRVVVLSGTSIKSITSIKKQLNYLAGFAEGSPYDKEMEILGKVGLVFTQWEPGNPVEQVPSLLQNMTKIGDIVVPVLVKFGYIKYIQEIEFLGNWSLADNKKFQAGFDKIVN